MAARNTVCADTLTCCWDVKQQQTTTNLRQRLAGLVVKAFVCTATDSGVELRSPAPHPHSRHLPSVALPGPVIQGTQTLDLTGSPARRLASPGQRLGLVGPVSVYSDWVR